MKSHTGYITLNVPDRTGYVNITPRVEEAVKKSGVKEGLVLVNSMHITATKIKQDLIKLLDPENKHGESVYIVVGTGQAMKGLVELGLDDAVTYLAPQREGRQFPVTRTLLIEELAGWRFLYEGCLTDQGTETTITWTELKRRCLVSAEIVGDPMRLLTKEEARRFLPDRMRQAGIRLTSTTARCMFEPMQTHDGRQLCRFGKTPLWDHVLELNDGRIVCAVFGDWVARLVNYGKSRQGPG
jgi:hypothetical protein